MTAQTEELDRLLRGLTSKMRKAFLDAVAKLGDKIDVKALEELLRAGRVNEAINVVSAAAVISGFRPLAVEATYSTIFAARAAADAAAKIADLVRHDIVFDQTETEALDYLRRNEMNLIRETSAQALASIRATIIAGQTAGRNPRDTARDVRDFIGLTSRQTQAVLNYRSALENQQADALNRALRDRRFDSTAARAFNAGEPLPPEKIDAMVGRYRDRYLKYRAETIARTEALRAANGGAQLAWQQQVSAGKVEAAQVTRQWHHAHDGRVREAHLAIPLMNPDGVGLNEPFQSPLGPIMYPGDPSADPANSIQCRCVLTYRLSAEALRQAA